MLLILCVGLKVCEAKLGVVGAKQLGEINPLFKGGLVMVLGDGALVPDTRLVQTSFSCDIYEKNRLAVGRKGFKR